MCWGASRRPLLWNHRFFSVIPVLSSALTGARMAWAPGGILDCFFFAGSCLGLSRAERPSVSWTKVLETLCLQQPKRCLTSINYAKTCIRPQVPKYLQVKQTQRGTETKHRQKKGLQRFLSKAGSPKGKMQPQEEGFGETRGKHLCQSGSANKGRGFWWNPKEAPMPEPKWSSESMENVWNILCI